MLDQIEAESLVDIDGVIVEARNQRMKMVQTLVSIIQYSYYIIIMQDALCSISTCSSMMLFLSF